MLKTELLPRQARDKHIGKSQPKGGACFRRFLMCTGAMMTVVGSATYLR
jgi:hypothetical protein